MLPIFFFFHFTVNLKVDCVVLKFFISKITVWSFLRRPHVSWYWRSEIRVRSAKLCLAVYPQFELTLFTKWSLFYISLRKEEILLAGIHKYKLQNCSEPAKKKQRQVNTTGILKRHTITLYCLPDLNKENAWDLEILLSVSVYQLSWSVKDGNGIGYVLLPLWMACVRIPAICYSRVKFPAAQPCPGFLSWQAPLKPRKAVACWTPMHFFFMLLLHSQEEFWLWFQLVSPHTVQILHQEQLEKEITQVSAQHIAGTSPPSH